MRVTECQLEDEQVRLDLGRKSTGNDLAATRNGLSTRKQRQQRSHLVDDLSIYLCWRSHFVLFALAKRKRRGFDKHLLLLQRSCWIALFMAPVAATLPPPHPLPTPFHPISESIVLPDWLNDCAKVERRTILANLKSHAINHGLFNFFPLPEIHMSRHLYKISIRLMYIDPRKRGRKSINRVGIKNGVFNLFFCLLHL